MLRGNSVYYFLGAALLLCGADRRIYGQTAADASGRVAGKGDPQIFQGPVAAFAPDIFVARGGRVLRVLTVDERVGCARKNALVRVPLFFHQGECSDPNALNIFPAGGKLPVPYQADDIRRDASGKVARMHVYFYTDIDAWGRKQFAVVPGRNLPAKALPITQQGDKITLAGEEIMVTFFAAGPFEGAISGIATRAGKIAIPNGHLGPAVTVIRQNKKLEVTQENAISYGDPGAMEVKDMRWAAGPLFSKLLVKVAPKTAPNDIAEYLYMIPRHGSEIIQTELLYPAEGDKTSDTVGAKGNALLQGGVVLGAGAESDQKVVSVPAGLRKELRSVFSYANDALVNEKAGLSMFMVPGVQMGANGVTRDAAGLLNFNGSADFQTREGSNSSSLRVFWGQVRYVFSKATTLEDLWKISCENFEQLTAVVDEPSATPDDFLKFAKLVSKEFVNIKYWTPAFEAKVAMNYLGDKIGAVKGLIAKTPTRDDLQVGEQIPTRENIEETFSQKMQGVPPVDPYTLTYSKSAIVPLSAYIAGDDRLDQWSATLAQISRLANGQVNDFGWPYVRSFTNAANMHEGTYLMGMWGGRKTGNNDLVQWCRDATQNEAVRATYGHAQRPYSLDITTSGISDVLYISVTDFFLRMNELVNGEDLSIHPSVYGRYHDCVDVNTDIYQHKISDKGQVEPCPYRAMMFRAQQHDHRWQLYGDDPFLCMLGRASDGGRVGITEACYYTQAKIGHPVSWNALMTDYFLPAVMVTQALKGYKPAARPPLPANVKIARSGNENALSWDPVPDAVGYRIYRAEKMGGPWDWLNSPYKKMAPFELPSGRKLHGNPVVPPILDTLVKTNSFTDATGSPTSVYLVTAQDKSGRESRWIPGEPVPTAGK